MRSTKSRCLWPPARRPSRIEYLPGQYDQRADSAVQCLQLLLPGRRPEVAAARVLVLRGELAASDLQRIKRYCINPVDSREAALAKPLRLALGAARPPAVPGSAAALSPARTPSWTAWATSWGWPWTPPTCAICQAYFRDREQRDPTLTEIRLLDTYWSDHCRHTTFLTAIDRVAIAPGGWNEPVRRAYESYQETAAAARRRAAGRGLPDGPGPAGHEGAARQGLPRRTWRSPRRSTPAASKAEVDVDGDKEEWLVMFKNETHNHPTEIEPFGGAATCLGGAIRDPLSGRAYVYQAMRVTGSGDPRQPVAETLPGKLPQRKITTEAAQATAPTATRSAWPPARSSEIYHPGYVAKRMEIGAVVGAAPRSHVVRRGPGRRRRRPAGGRAHRAATASAAPPAPPRPTPSSRC